MTLLIAALVSLLPFNSSFIYPDNQSGKGAAEASFGCITAGNTILDPSGTMQILYAAYDAAGEFLWADSIHFEQSSEIYAVQNCGDLILFTGSSSNQSTSEDALAWAVSEDCQHQWSYTMNQSLQERFTTAAIGTDGTIVCAGSTNSIGAGGNDVLLVALDGNGDHLWTKTYGTTGEEAVYHVSPCDDGGYVMACQAMDWGAGNGDCWIIRIDSKGDTLWTGTYGGPEFDYPWRVVENAGNIYVAANTLSFGEGSYDWWILKLDQSGNLLWSRTWGYENTDTCMALTARDDGIVAAGAGEPILNLSQASAVTYNDAGDVVDEWFFQPGMIRSVIELSDGNFLFGGTTWTSDADLWVFCTDTTGWTPEMGLSTQDTQNELLLSSNPAGTSVIVTLPGTSSRIEVRDMSGRIVDVETAVQGSCVIHTGTLPTGVYVVSAEGVKPVRMAVVH